MHLNELVQLNKDQIRSGQQIKTSLWSRSDSSSWKFAFPLVQSQLNISKLGIYASKSLMLCMVS